MPIQLDPEAILERIHNLEIRMRDNEASVAHLRIGQDAHHDELMRHSRALDLMRDEMRALRARVEKLDEELKAT